MASIAELKKQLAEEAKKAAEQRKGIVARRKEIAAQQRRIHQALKKVGAIIIPKLWEAPEETRAWVKAEVIRELNKDEAQRKLAQELIDGLNDYANNKKYEAEQKGAAEAKKKPHPTPASTTPTASTALTASSGLAAQ